MLASLRRTCEPALTQYNRNVNLPQVNVSLVNTALMYEAFEYSDCVMNLSSSVITKFHKSKTCKDIDPPILYIILFFVIHGTLGLCFGGFVLILH